MDIQNLPQLNHSNINNTPCSGQLLTIFAKGRRGRQFQQNKGRRGHQSEKVTKDIQKRSSLFEIV